jgi:hypothetical protein
VAAPPARLRAPRRRVAPCALRTFSPLEVLPVLLAPRAAAARPLRRLRPATRVPLSAPFCSRPLETQGESQGFESLSDHCEESHVVLPARSERHIHAALWGLCAIERSGVSRRGQVLQRLLCRFGGQVRRLFCVAFVRAHCAG